MLEVIKEINKVLKSLLWSHGDISKGKAKVAWLNIYRPKTMGGLGIKDLEVWNKCMIMKHLWNITTDKNTLWVKWVNIVKLKGRSIWAINKDVGDSWRWKNILKMRDEARNFIVMKIGNGVKASVIYDNWSGDGILQSFITNMDLYNARRIEDIVIKDIVDDGVCQWPVEWIIKYPILSMHQRIKLDSSKEDYLVWKSRSGNEKKLTVIQAYHDLSNTGEMVKWSRLHLFFQCKFVEELWNKVNNKMELTNDSRYWNDIVDLFSNMYSGNSINSIIRRLSLSACVYLIWQERSCRIVRIERTNGDLFNSFNEIIRMRLMSLKAKNSQAMMEAQKRGPNTLAVGTFLYALILLVMKGIIQCAVMADFVLGRVVIDAAQRKHVKYEAKDIYGDHVVSCADITGIKHRHNGVRDTLVDICYRSRISARLDVCVDLTGSSPLTQTEMADFVPDRTVIDVAQRKRVKYTAKKLSTDFGLKAVGLDKRKPTRINLLLIFLRDYRSTHSRETPNSLLLQELSPENDRVKKK
nr:hypothetical protein [Tanacetum cinerariifolium]